MLRAEEIHEDILSMPVLKNDNAPLVAMLDSDTMNRNIKMYIIRLMKDMVGLRTTILNVCSKI